MIWVIRLIVCTYSIVRPRWSQWQRWEMVPRFQLLLIFWPSPTWTWYCGHSRHCQTLADYQKSRWWPPKPDMEITVDQTEPVTRFQRLLPHLRPCQKRLWHCRYWRTLASYRNSRWRLPILVSMAAILNFGSQPTSDKDDRVISKSAMFENMGLKVEIAVHLSPFKNYFHFQFSGHHLEFQ